jgi:2-polyprenyl-3-methyl-5-hydroxy-6-metoxy-1,4-benzoquinol methylase
MNEQYYTTNYLSHLPNDRNISILDIGCGQGDFIRYLHSLDYRNIVAVDMDNEALSSFAGLEGVVQIAAHIDSNFLRKMDRKFGLIVAKQMIYYIERRNVFDFVDAIKNALTDDGTLIVEIFNGSLISGRFTELKDPGILTAYTEHSIRRILEGAGFQILACFGFAHTKQTIKSQLYGFLQSVWFRIYRMILILERGRDDELPSIRQKTLIVVAQKRK